MDGSGGDDAITEIRMSGSRSAGTNEERTFIVLRREIYDEARLSIQISGVNAGTARGGPSHTFDG